VQNRLPLRRPLSGGMPVEVVGKDRLDGTVGSRADLKGALGGGFQSGAAIGSGEPYDAETCAEALLGMRTVFEDKFAQCHSGGADRGGIPADALDRPAGIAPMARRHVVRDGRVLVVATHALVRGDPFTLVEDLDGARGQTGLDLGTGEAVGKWFSTSTW
jgi:hypothetical protein